MIAIVNSVGQCDAVPRYEPIDAGIPLRASASDLVAFRWETNGITADFLLPDDDAHVLRVSFDQPCIVRLLDEMPLSTEDDDTPNEGRVSEHFAYCVEGARFAGTVRAMEGSQWASDALPIRHRLGMHGRAEPGYPSIFGDKSLKLRSR